MQSINETSVVSNDSSSKQSRSKLKSVLGIFKKGRNKISSTESVSSDGSFVHRIKFNSRRSSLSLSDADEDDENILVGELKL